MSTLDANPSHNGRVPAEWSQSWSHFRVERRSPGYCRVRFDHAPINTITATTVGELSELVGLIEKDADLNVVVFDSANPDFYLAHYDTEHDPERTASLPACPFWFHSLLVPLMLLSPSPVVSIPSILWRAPGDRYDFVLPYYLRFPPRFNILLS